MNNLDSPAMPIEQYDDFGAKCLKGGFTKREQAALTLRIPMSGDEELDAMIRASRNLELALMMHTKVNSSDSFKMLENVRKDAGL